MWAEDHSEFLRSFSISGFIKKKLTSFKVNLSGFELM